MIDNKDEFASLDMLPILAYAIKGGLESAKKQLSQLRQIEKNPHFLDDETFNRIIYSCIEQTKSIVDEKELCVHWRKQNLTTEQMKFVEEITTNLIEIETINQQTLFLATDYKEQTKDKVFNLEESKLTLDSLTEKLYPSIDLSNTANQQRKSFSLPPGVTYQYEKIENKGVFYTFHHAEWGEIGRIDIISIDGQPQITIHETVSNPEDPLTELRNALFRIVIVEFSSELEKKHRPDVSAILSYFDPKLKKNVWR